MRPKSAIYTTKQDDERPHHFYMGVPPSPAPWGRLLVILRLSLLDMNEEKLFIEGAFGKNPSQLLMLFSANSFFLFFKQTLRGLYSKGESRRISLGLSF